MSEHPREELAALLAGELDLQDVRLVVRHLRRCDECKADLVEVAAASGALRAVDPSLLGNEAEVSARPSTRSPRARKWFAGGFAIAAAILLVVGVVAVIRIERSPSSSPTATVALQPPGGSPTSADGTVSMAPGSEGSTAMTLSTSLGPAPAGSFYEVWLFEPESGKMVAVGVLPAGASTTYSVPAALIESYDAIDVSLQQDNGDPRHSEQSLLRARYA